MTIRYSSLTPTGREDHAGLNPYLLTDMPAVLGGKMLIGERIPREGQPGKPTYFRPENLPEMRLIKNMTPVTHDLNWFVCDDTSPGVIDS